MFIDIRLVVILLLVVHGSEGILPTPPSGQKVDLVLTFFFFLRFCFFAFRGEGRKKERERNISVWWPLTHTLMGT